MFAFHFMLFLALGWTLLEVAESRPSSAVAVELSTCGSGGDVDTLTEECISICQPVREAQNCAFGAACTCSAAPPVAVQACLQCHLDADAGSSSPEVPLLMSSRLSTYAQLCGYSPVAEAEAVNVQIHRTDLAGNLTVQRETLKAQCIYGLPQLATFGPTTYILDKIRLWPLYGLVLVMVLLLLKVQS